ncbi:FkbM family methyltransferase [Prosthecobacter sp.]|jgi:FkbM family methyltransferase|uniref:FkbM family methyltransferase n=1 Tax=Prosthecobacter sp. TaxID=1965333 RepID=UPI0037C6A50F
MNKLVQIKNAFLSGRISKGDYISEMSVEHEHLFSYAEFLNGVNIEEIRLKNGVVIAELKNPRISMICMPGDMRSSPFEVLNFSDYERDEIQATRRIISSLGGAAAHFIDVGANTGFYSLALAHYFPGISGFAFEPIPQTYEILRRNFELNGLHGIRPLNLGVSDKSGELIFYSYPNLSAAASLTRLYDADNVEEVRCEVVRLDDYCQDHAVKADFIKCDVEGAELLVFRGAEKLLARDRPVVFSEMLRKWCAKYDYHPNDLIQFMMQLGYGCFVIKSGCLVSCPCVTEQTTDTNYLFLHGEKHAEIIAGWA